MSIGRWVRRLCLLGIAGVLGVMAAPVLGYIGQAPVQIGIAGPSGMVSCLDDVTLTATIVDTSTGHPVAEQVVGWELTRDVASDDALSAPSSVTDAQGQATVTLSFGMETGVREVTASVTIVSTPIQVRCDVGLPQTSLDPPGEPPASRLDALAPVPDIDLPARAVRIPRLGITAPIVDGDGVDVPLTAVAHHPATAWPGQGSNSSLYGHARDARFGDLWQVRTGDLVEVELARGGIARYRVTAIRPLVAWDDLSVLAQTGTERLTLQTCLWYDRTSPRLVVIAEPVTAG
jgi:LPXTG-site transpeptidase (sortase) family protein